MSTGKRQVRANRKQNEKMRRQAQEYGYTEREWKRISAQEKSESLNQWKLWAAMAGLLVLLSAMIFFVWYVVFRSHDYALAQPFDKDHYVLGIPSDLNSVDQADGFSADLCVTDTDVARSSITMEASTGALFDINNVRVDYAKDIFTRRSPASLTKIMTALVALKYGNPDDKITVTETALDIEVGSSVCDIKVGDTFSLKQLIYGMLIASGNDAAMMIAEHVGGSVEQFVELMNMEAKELGCTQTHFTNPHGLTDSEHYTCAYDIYLMFNAAMKYDMYMDIIQRENYYAEYTNAEGSPAAVTWESTDHYLIGTAIAPDNVIVFGGKTGTTSDAGGCLALLVKDLYGNPYVSIIMHSQDHDTVYDDMNKVLSLIGT